MENKSTRPGHDADWFDHIVRLFVPDGPRPRWQVPVLAVFWIVVVGLIYIAYLGH